MPIALFKEWPRLRPRLDRPMLMANVVSSLARVQQRIDKLDVLSIGPRSEIEIFGLIGAGFSPDRIRAVDLFSYSPFVEIGDEIKVGQVLCIIEAMKMMNQIEADKSGRIASVMARNGDPVEFGQPLFVVE